MSEDEKRRIHRVLFASDCDLKLPCAAEKSVEVEGEAELQGAETGAGHPAPEEWLPQPYGEFLLLIILIIIIIIYYNTQAFVVLTCENTNTVRALWRGSSGPSHSQRQTRTSSPERSDL